ncbi:MAG: hypothetical protein ABR903_04415, partial [Thermodesulfovibrionales bacterium]
HAHALPFRAYFAHQVYTNNWLLITYRITVRNNVKTAGLIVRFKNPEDAVAVYCHSAERTHFAIMKNEVHHLFSSRGDRSN